MTGVWKIRHYMGIKTTIASNKARNKALKTNRICSIKPTLTLIPTPQNHKSTKPWNRSSKPWPENIAIWRGKEANDFLYLYRLILLYHTICTYKCLRKETTLTKKSICKRKLKESRPTINSRKQLENNQAELRLQGAWEGLVEGWWMAEIKLKGNRSHSRIWK